MNLSDPTRPYLAPEQGIEIVEGQTVAAIGPAWLHIEPVAELVRHKWVCLRYASSFFDEPVRPLIRFISKNGDTTTLAMNGPVLGAAEWIGRIPDGTVCASISPVRRPGPFTFRLDGINAVRRGTLVRRGLRRHDWLYWAARSRFVNSRREAWQSLSFAADGTPVGDYAEWHARLARPLDRGGLDRPRTDWHTGPVFRLILKLGQGDPDRLRETIRSLRAQIYPRWILHVITDATTNSSLRSALRQQAESDSRLSEIVLDAAQPEQFARMIDRDDILAMIDAGDSLADYALAVVAEDLARDPECELIYSDEDSIAPDGSLLSPILKPDWSPVLQQEFGYIGRLTLLRARLLPSNRFQRLLTDEKSTIEEIVKSIPRSAIRHIRRILYTRRNSPARNTLRPGVGARRVNDDPPQWPEVAVVIPTRDGAKLLAECLSGLRDKTDYPGVETIIVDNGSAAPDALDLLRQAAGWPRVTVLDRPGPFNYSALCNDAARTTKAPVLLFLNNDIVMLEPDWLKAMVRWAIKPDIGAVGAKLLFANGLIQHAGVVLGFGGIAGHVYRRLPKDTRGYLAQLTAPREVTAVTAACVAVERSKFESIGGFDAEHLPIDLNDIDLCLRIAERGWTNIWTPEATLIHRQSATRGIDSDPFALYQKERTYFVQRWSHVIRDDPYFHPAFSLYAHDVALA
jgi:GT2 family glycosyltransferase